MQSYRSSRRPDDTLYHGSYELQKSERRFRAPDRHADVPPIYGPHTAKVVGEKNKGEEGDIDVDEYGRIFVRFHWDREDESTSCRDAGRPGLVGQELGRAGHPAHRPGGGRRVPRGQSRTILS